VGVGMTKATMKQWGYVDEGHDTLCVFGDHEQTDRAASAPGSLAPGRSETG